MFNNISMETNAPIQKNLTDCQKFKKFSDGDKAKILAEKASRKKEKIERRNGVKSAKGLSKTSQEIITSSLDMSGTALAFQNEVCTVSTCAEQCQHVPLPEQEKFEEVGTFIAQKEQPATSETESISKARQEAPAKFVVCLIKMFPQSIELNKLPLCVILKLLFGRIDFVKPRCKTAIDVRRHLHIQDLNNRNVDGSIAAKAKVCAENSGCLDCTGIQSWNVLRHHGFMYVRPIKKMLFSLLNGRETALEAFWKFLEMEYDCKFDDGPCIVGRYSSLIDMFVPQFHKMEHFDGFQRFSDKERGEIAKMILDQCGMTIEEVESRITAFLSEPPE